MPFMLSGFRIELGFGQIVFEGAAPHIVRVRLAHPNHVDRQPDKKDEEYQERDHRVDVDSRDAGHIMFDVAHGKIIEVEMQVPEVGL